MAADEDLSASERESEPVAEGARSVAPSGREARLWRVLVELSQRVGEVESDPVTSSDASGRATSPPPKPFGAGQIERLVVEFDDAYTAYIEGIERLPSEAQLVALQAVDRQLAALVRAQESELWTQQALRQDPRWIEARRSVLAVIDAYAWPAIRLALVAPGAVAEAHGTGRSSGGVSSGPRSRP